jgi:hypothetical protein
LADKGFSGGFVALTLEIGITPGVGHDSAELAAIQGNDRPWIGKISSFLKNPLKDS